MKLVYAVDKGSFNNPDHAGVNIKVSSHLKQIRKLGFEAELQQYEWKGGYPQIQISEDTDFLYFRRIDSSVKLLLKLREIKKINPNIRLIMEIPTYPFEGEEKEKKTIKKRINRVVGDRFLHCFIDRIALCGQVDKIKTLYGIPVIHFVNGADFSQLPINPHDSKAGDDVHMICVSGCMLSHGYDRMIEGMHQYYKNTGNGRKVYFHIVGTGEKLDEYRSLAAGYPELEDKVIFYGRKTGTELDEIYAKCNMTVAHLAIHRIGLTQISSLKTREYVAKGLPVISSSMMDICTSDTERYIKIVPGDETPVNIVDIISFFDKVYAEKNVRETIRNVFMHLCDWECTFTPIGNYLLSK